jgi:hypothetical protein
VRDDQEIQLPGPPRTRVLLAGAVLLLAAALLLGLIPFNAQTAAIGLILVGAGLLF